ncbi:uncharacterized protein TRIVIDRAFT_197618 [Trichoderma virens Gv29-8]|uniref:Uncharacterized protein n=1 Tax=Hypocrea virens (strain Gv29-8 / FGSC 10586) TaxID=413071 RepID=G9MHK9_HYPVG|nr:uncharacterized protein TRIVIDRAFT_197618 [Trichoderma virens Gv29-8]EHK26197.1 hypothetical protein TRIVIDRAFT_197618 [Trichoderma virens Gv29-8]UKZ46383.1 hypothetical protein TrVGV298_000584 [Trichoderma virens]
MPRSPHLDGELTPGLLRKKTLQIRFSVPLLDQTSIVRHLWCLLCREYIEQVRSTNPIVRRPETCTSTASNTALVVGRVWHTPAFMAPRLCNRPSRYPQPSCKGSKLTCAAACDEASGAEEKVDAAHYLLRQPVIECLVADGGDEDSINAAGECCKLHKGNGNSSHLATIAGTQTTELNDDGEAVIAFYSVLDPTSNTDETGDASR